MNKVNLEVFIYIYKKNSEISAQESCTFCFTGAGIWAVLCEEFRKIWALAFLYSSL